MVFGPAGNAGVAAGGAVALVSGARIAPGTPVAGVLLLGSGRPRSTSVAELPSGGGGSGSTAGGVMSRVRTSPSSLMATSRSGRPSPDANHQRTAPAITASTST